MTIIKGMISIGKNVTLVKGPGSLSRKRLTEASQADTFDEAREEWVADEHIKEDDPGFKPACDLCNTHVKSNDVIANIHNNNRLHLGNECIRKFEIKTRKPDARAFTKFKKTLINLLEIRGWLHCRLVFNRQNPSEKEVTRMFEI
ncbi:hypothetical protein [Mechercharimyces sp. CAU 1602]|uniref:hypothetical protein n=1 Tax=Mechercharimyces sp. CAU 1602 TaxID=2973933 RepID=UPI0021618756|nr:hypothetical protein [Mechercharimyces sp. CAU 1602]